MNLDPSAFLADPELIQALDRHSIEVSCGADQVLFRQGDAPVGLYILHKGEVSLTHTSPKTWEFASIQVLPGSVLGLPGLVGNRPYTLTAISTPSCSTIRCWPSRLRRCWPLRCAPRARESLNFALPQTVRP